MLSQMYPFWSYILAVLIAQASKPFISYFQGNKFNWHFIFASGGHPSSHTAGVAALCTAVGIVEKFDSTIFAVTVALGLIVSYDAANVRYYAGKNIKLTKQIVSDLKEENIIEVDEPIYDEKIKEVLGHKWSEVLSGGLLGIAVAIIINFIR